MTESQSQDLQAAIEEISKGTKDAENLKLQISTWKTYAEKLVEEIAALTKVKKRVRTVSYIELGVGIPMFALGCLPIWTDAQKNIQNLLLGIGGSLAAAGGTGLVISFTF